MVKFALSDREDPRALTAEFGAAESYGLLQGIALAPSRGGPCRRVVELWAGDMSFEDYF